MYSNPTLLPGLSTFKLRSKMQYSNEALDQDLARVADAWADLQSSHARDSVYSYLTAIYEVVEWWSADGKAESRARRALARHNIKKPEVIEPFAALIVASAHPTILDKRMISKWSRVLRYAAKFKSPSEPLAEFFEGRGGINDCAARYARRLGRRAQ